MGAGGLWLELESRVEQISHAAYCRKLRLEQDDSRAWLTRLARGREPSPWQVPASLSLKVHATGRLVPFQGDTVVFPLDPPGLEGCARLQSRLTSGLEDLFAEPLKAETLHLTLHDLSHGPEGTVPLPDLEVNAQACRWVFQGLRAWLEAHPESTGIRLRPVRLFDCLNLSVLAGYAPATEFDHRALQNLHQAFETVRRADHWLRPHVTLAYFRPRVPTRSQVRELARRLRNLEPGPDLHLSVWDLAYQRFEDMNRYRTIFTVRTT